MIPRHCAGQARRTTIAVSWFAAALVGAWGCGDGRGMSCDTVDACGGDVAGSWSIADSCLDAAVSHTDNVTGCEDTFTGTLHVRMNGTFSFDADGRYVAESTLLGTADLLITPSPCFMETCADLVRTVMPATPLPDATIVEAACTAQAGRCRCAMSFRPGAAAEQGSYAVSDGTLTLTPAGATAAWSTPFCVTDDEMRMQPAVPFPNPLAWTATELRGGITLVRR